MDEEPAKHPSNISFSCFHRATLLGIVVLIDEEPAEHPSSPNIVSSFFLSCYSTPFLRIFIVLLLFFFLMEGTSQSYHHQTCRFHRATLFGIVVLMDKEPAAHPSSPNIFSSLLSSCYPCWHHFVLMDEEPLHDHLTPNAPIKMYELFCIVADENS